jgi:di/tricarboxylate transporter
MDYIRFGVPLSIIIGIATVLIVPMIWPLQAQVITP